MTLNLRLAVAGGTMTVLALVGGTFTSATAAEPACDSPEALHAAVVSARTDVLLARQAFKAVNRPVAQLLAEQRREARAEVRQSRAAIRVLRHEAHATTSPAERKAIRVQLRAERHDIAKAQRLLRFPKVARAAVKAERIAARAQLVAARRVLRSARQLEETCSTAGANAA
jgi:hypothetical protein